MRKQISGLLVMILLVTTVAAVTQTFERTNDGRIVIKITDGTRTRVYTETSQGRGIFAYETLYNNQRAIFYYNAEGMQVNKEGIPTGRTSTYASQIREAYTQATSQATTQPASATATPTATQPTQSTSAPAATAAPPPAGGSSIKVDVPRVESPLTRYVEITAPQANIRSSRDFRSNANNVVDTVPQGTRFELIKEGTLSSGNTYYIARAEDGRVVYIFGRQARTVTEEVAPPPATTPAPIAEQRQAEEVAPPPREISTAPVEPGDPLKGTQVEGVMVPEGIKEHLRGEGINPLEASYTEEGNTIIANAPDGTVIAYTRQTDGTYLPRLVLSPPRAEPPPAPPPAQAPPPSPPAPPADSQELVAEGGMPSRSDTPTRVPALSLSLERYAVRDEYGRTVMINGRRANVGTFQGGTSIVYPVLQNDNLVKRERDVDGRKRTEVKIRYVDPVSKEVVEGWIYDEGVSRTTVSSSEVPPQLRPAAAVFEQLREEGRVATSAPPTTPAPAGRVLGRMATEGGLPTRINFPPNVDINNIRWNKKSEDAKRLQEFLNQQGEKITVDGIWGPSSEAALENYLRRQGSTTPLGLFSQQTPDIGSVLAGTQPTNAEFMRQLTIVRPGVPSATVPSAATLYEIRIDGTTVETYQLSDVDTNRDGTVDEDEEREALLRYYNSEEFKNVRREMREEEFFSYYSIVPQTAPTRRARIGEPVQLPGTTQYFVSGLGTFSNEIAARNAISTYESRWRRDIEAFNRETGKGYSFDELTAEQKTEIGNWRLEKSFASGRGGTRIVGYPVYDEKGRVSFVSIDDKGELKFDNEGRATLPSTTSREFLRRYFIYQESRLINGQLAYRASDGKVYVMGNSLEERGKLNVDEKGRILNQEASEEVAKQLELYENQFTISEGDLQGQFSFDEKSGKYFVLNTAGGQPRWESFIQCAEPRTSTPRRPPSRTSYPTGRVTGMQAAPPTAYLPPLRGSAASNGDPRCEQLNNARLYSGNTQLANFGRILRAAEKYQNLAGTLSSLLFGDDFDEWREKVDKAFNNFVFTSPWFAEELCKKHIKKVPSNVVVFETARGEREFIGHVEGTRSKLIESPQGTEYFYKITYAMRAPQEENVEFNVVLRGERTARVYYSTQSLSSSQSVSGTGSNAFVTYSPYLFTQVCIVGTYEICNNIVETASSRENFVEAVSDASPQQRQQIPTERSLYFE